MPSRYLLQLFNSEGKTLETFKPRNPEEVGLYCCGPTVYSYAHIGNMRAYTVQDVLRRLLKVMGYPLKHVMNITDIGHLSDDGDEGEDKMILSAREKGMSVKEIAEQFETAFFADSALMAIERPDIVCRATDHIPEMIEMIRRIEAAGCTYYKAGNLYFDTGKIPDYGRLVGGLERAENALVSRTGNDTAKKRQRDFVLWFSQGKYSDQAMQWDSPWGRGYPGWHIECSAMAAHYLGSRIDIHCGGMDHCAVHHTNEIAQSESVLAVKPWVRYWLHNEFVVMNTDRSGRDAEKLSKSKGTALTVSALRGNGFEPLDYRYFLLGTHYRSQIQFRYEALTGARRSRLKLRNRAQELIRSAGSAVPFSPGELYRRSGRGELSPSLEESIKQFIEAMCSDLNTPRALACLWNAVKNDQIPPGETLELLRFGDALLQIGLETDLSAPQFEPDPVIASLIQKRESERKAGHFAQADLLREEIRRQLAKDQMILVDTPSGPKVERQDFKS